MLQSDYLYRIVSLSRALDLFGTRQLHLSLPSEWDDPFETLLQHRRTHALFAQCWCKKSVSDAMWRVYSPDRKSVRLRTTRAKLTAFAASHAQGGLTYWVRDVTYETPTRIRTSLLRLVSRLRTQFELSEAVSSLFAKREAFDYENEVRLVVHDACLADSISPQKSLRLSVDAHALVDSIMFDPRADDSFYLTSQQHLRATIGFKGFVGRSALYRKQTPMVVE